ncbi:predicted protein, partial [Naegleria gruberi]
MVAKKPQDIDSSSSDEDLPAVEVEYPTTPVKARKQQAAKKLRKLKAMSPVANRNKRKQSTSVSSSNSALDDGISTVVSSSLLSNSTLLDSSSTAPSSSNNSSSSNSGRDSFASSSSEHDIMAIKAQMQEMIGVLRTVTGNISELTKKVQEREEESDDDFVNPEAISPEVWLRQTYRDLRRVRGEARVFPVTYLDVDFTNSENLKLNRVRGLCKIFLSTYYLFNYNEKSPNYVPPTVIGADGAPEAKY